MSEGNRLQALYDACENGQIAILNQVLERHEDRKKTHEGMYQALVIAATEKGELYRASRNGDLDVVEKLLATSEILVQFRSRRAISCWLPVTGAGLAVLCAAESGCLAMGERLLQFLEVQAQAYAEGNESLRAAGMCG